MSKLGRMQRIDWSSCMKNLEQEIAEETEREDQRSLCFLSYLLFEKVTAFIYGCWIVSSLRIGQSTLQYVSDESAANQSLDATPICPQLLLLAIHSKNLNPNLTTEWIGVRQWYVNQIVI